MHGTTKMFLDRIHQGEAPPSWGTGDTHFQKAKFIASTAWNAVKSAEDPELAACDLSHQETLVGITESIMAGNRPDDTPFALAVKNLCDQIPKEELKP